MNVRSTTPRERTPAAIVSGGAGGIGIEVVRRFASQGSRVFVFDQSSDASARLDAELGDLRDRVIALTVDVADRDQVDAAVHTVRAECDRLDVLVNMAGAFRSATLRKIGDTDLDDVLSSHVAGTLNTMRAAAPIMTERRYGRIVNTSSITVQGAFGGAVYGAAKGAIEAMTRSVAIELGRHGITANCVAPGYIDAGMFTRMPATFTESAANGLPLGRTGTPDEIASCVAFLASQESSYVTGQVLTACGGATLLH
ncbi:SDR family NAD(P)-dependent oxidoreductase [Dietzia sp. KRD202]|uniref:SDR family NAD(P)-dependent oxidoreductase n=1 Tax=Dietzia sp. KRD202 TaxID=2729732 RepID=UPI0019D26D2E|nr:SDR family NAD(P)-dependent oxidoreductase [Dietzia sp. KRD202]